MSIKILWNSSWVWSEFFKKYMTMEFFEVLRRFWSEFFLSAIVFNNSDNYEIIQELEDHRILVKFFQDLIRILQEIDDCGILMKFPRISIRILVASPSIQQFKWEWKSQMSTEFWSEFFSRIRWPQNSREILQIFGSEIWLSAIVSNNSDDYEILKNQMTMEFLWNSSRIWLEFFKI